VESTLGGEGNGTTGIKDDHGEDALLRGRRNGVIEHEDDSAIEIVRTV